MVSKKLKFLQIKICVITFIIYFYSGNLFSQNNNNLDSIFTSIFDYNLLRTNTNSLNNSLKPIIIVSGLNCSGCVKYFTNNQKKYFFIFVLNSESLLDAERLKTNYKLSNKNIYFTTCENIKERKTMICENPTPCCRYKSKSAFHFLDYSSLSNISNEFSLNHKELELKLKK